MLFFFCSKKKSKPKSKLARQDEDTAKGRDCKIQILIEESIHDRLPTDMVDENVSGDTSTVQEEPLQDDQQIEQVVSSINNAIDRVLPGFYWVFKSLLFSMANLLAPSISSSFRFQSESFPLIDVFSTVDFFAGRCHRHRSHLRRQLDRRRATRHRHPFEAVVRQRRAGQSCRRSVELLGLLKEKRNERATNTEL